MTLLGLAIPAGATTPRSQTFVSHISCRGQATHHGWGSRSTGTFLTSGNCRLTHQVSTSSHMLRDRTHAAHFALPQLELFN